MKISAIRDLTICFGRLALRGDWLGQIQKDELSINRIPVRAPPNGDALASTIDNLSASSISSEMALGRIVDSDFALESQKLAKEQILNQSSNAMLVQTNNSKSRLLQLIG